jgi:hypothetical protein
MIEADLDHTALFAVPFSIRSTLPPMRIATSLCVIFLALCTFASGCQNTAADEAEAATQQPEVDPRFASAESLLTHYNSITTRDPVDSNSAFELFYAENDLQRRYIDATRKMTPVAELDYLMFQTFGEGWLTTRKKPMLAPDQPAKMTKVDAQRAEARFVDSEGKSKNLMLVKVGDRWWVSGYSIEHDRDKEVQESLKQIDQLDRISTELGAAAPKIAAQIRDGTIKSAKDARQALAQAVIQAMAPPR